MANPSISYTVHGAHLTKVTRKATVGGAEVLADVPALVVEVVSGCEAMGHTFNFVGAPAEAAQAIFTPGAKVVATFKKEN